MMNKWLVTATPPTTNGDLHVGHLSGPYLAGDVFSRWQRMRGDTVLFVSGGDDHQTFVVTTAQRLGTSPEGLAAECNTQIQETLVLANIDLDAFVRPNPEYIADVQAFFVDLNRAGKLRKRRQTFRYSEADNRYLFEAYVHGYCPECYVATTGAICETCGHPNDGASLLDQTSSNAGRDAARDALVTRDLDVLTLALEDYRDQIENFYAQQSGGTRPHLTRFIRQMLERRLPEFPISYPSTWGIPVPIPGFQGQVFNPWAEMYPALRHMARVAAGAQGLDGVEPWHADNGCRLVQFLGFDNSFYFSLAHLGLAFAHGHAAFPEAIVTNEFYYLDNRKFSTSRRHLIWARDLIARYGQDRVRFYLTYNSPENQVANFVESEFVAAIESKLQKPLERLLARLGGGDGQPITIPSTAHERFERFVCRITRAYELETFSMREASETVVNFLAYLANRPEAPSALEDSALARLGCAYLCAFAAPIVPRLAERLWAAIGDGSALSAAAVTRLRTLPQRPAPAVAELLPHE